MATTPPDEVRARLWESFSLATNDDSFYHRRFQEESVRVFGSDVDELDSLVIPCNDSDPPQATKSVNDILGYDRAKAKLYYHVIRQEYSWGRFLISRTSLETLLSYHKTFSRFYDVINAFGYKNTEDDKVWEGFHSHRSFIPDDEFENNQSELCYCIRYVYKHCSSPKQPWSLRQLGVYQQARESKGPSAWILVQPPEQLDQWLRNFIMANKKNFTITNATLHLAVLFAALSNWDEYIDYLRNELIYLEDKACFSSVGLDKPNDYPVAFADKQKLQRLRQRFLRTLAILDNNAAIIRNLKSQYRHGGGAAIKEQCYQVVAELDNHLGHCERYRRSVMTLLQEAHGIDQLLSKILEFRNDKALVQTSQGMQSSLETLNRLSAQSAEVVQQSKSDSRTLKMLTLIATIYLPASLLATLFSSNLVQVVQNGTGRDRGTHLELVTQFWVYIILTLVLTCATLLPTIILQRKLRFS